MRRCWLVGWAFCSKFDRAVTSSCTSSGKQTALIQRLCGQQHRFANQKSCVRVPLPDILDTTILKFRGAMSVIDVVLSAVLDLPSYKLKVYFTSYFFSALTL